MIPCSLFEHISDLLVQRQPTIKTLYGVLYLGLTRRAGLWAEVTTHFRALIHLHGIATLRHIWSLCHSLFLYIMHLCCCYHAITKKLSGPSHHHQRKHIELLQSHNRILVFVILGYCNWKDGRKIRFWIGRQYITSHIEQQKELWKIDVKVSLHMFAYYNVEAQ